MHYKARPEHVGRKCANCGNMILSGDLITHPRTLPPGAPAGTKQHVNCLDPQGLNTYKEEQETPEMTPTPTPTPTPEVPKLDKDQAALALGQILSALVPNQAGLSQEDWTKINEMIADKIQAEKIARTWKIELTRPDGSEIKIEKAHKATADVIAFLSPDPVSGERSNVYSYGSPGTGKTRMSYEIAKAMGLPWYFLQLNNQSPEWKIYGFIAANGSYIASDFYKWYTEGGVFLIDEIDFANGALLGSLNAALENGFCSFPCGIVKRHEDALLIGAGNTVGLGGTHGHADRRELDSATRARFAYVEVDVDEDLEEEVASALNPNYQPWLQFVRGVRDYAKRNKMPKLVASPRETFNGIRAINKMKAHKSLTYAKIADAFVFRGLEEETRKKILNECKLPR